MLKGERKTTLAGETVFVLQGFFPSYKDSARQDTPGRWSTLYSWCFACGDESSERLSTGTRARLKVLSAKAQGWTGIPGALNLHHDGLAYLKREDAHAAVKQIRKWKSCKYKVRVVRETVWKEVVIDDYAKEPLQRPFYWPPGSLGDPNAGPKMVQKLQGDGTSTIEDLQVMGFLDAAGGVTDLGQYFVRCKIALGQPPARKGNAPDRTLSLADIRTEALRLSKQEGRMPAIRYMRQHRPAWSLKGSMDQLAIWQGKRRRK